MMGKVWKYIHAAISPLVHGRDNEKPRRRRESRTIMLHAESLEPRYLLAANPITFDSAIAQIVIRGTTGDDNTMVSFDGADTILVSVETAGVTTQASFNRSVVSSIDFNGSSGNDVFENLTDINSRAVGGTGNDVLIGGSGIDVFYGNEGNDELISNQGDDQLFGQEGNDLIFGGDGNDVINGWLGDDILVGGAGHDQLSGKEGNDQLYGEDGNDQLLGLEGTDYLSGGDGDDFVQGGLGDDHLFGEAGNDELHGQDGNDQIFGGDGDDKITGWMGNDILVGETGHDELTGNDGNDELYGDQGNDSLIGSAGNDKLVGGGGIDVLQGGDDDDRLYGNAGNDQLSGDAGNDELYGQDDHDTLTGGLGDDLMGGGIGNDELTGNEGNDQLYGEEGDDRLVGLDGDDTLYGGDGADVLIAGDGDDQLFGEKGNDDLQGQDGHDQLYGGDGDDKITGWLGNDILVGGTGHDELTGNDGNDELYGDQGNDNLIGSAGNDKLLGGGGNDALMGGVGDDRLYGNSGNDQLYGEAGKDRLYGQDGNDIVFGGFDDDLLGGGDGNDQITGHEGNDALYGEAGDDNLLGSEGDDFLSGGLGNDVLTGSDGNDALLGREGNDQLYGNDGNDSLVGDIGDDLLKGDYGNDVLIGGVGVDELFGGWNDDILIGAATDYDLDSTKLRALSLAWSSATPYASRIATIEDEGFLAPLMAGETIIDDKVADSVFGADGQDWFFQSGVAEVYVPSDVHNHDEASTEPDHGHHHSGPVIIDNPPDLEGFALISAMDLLSDRETTEALQSVLPHADSTVLQREHLSLFETVRYDQVTHYAIHDGAWSDPGTWHDGQVPTNDANVLIPLNVAVQVDTVVATRLSTIRIDGTLSFDATADTELRVDTVVVSSSGTFEMGSEAAPIQANVTARLLFTDDGPIDRTVDPFGISRGLVSHGIVSIHGAEVTSYVALTSSAFAGSLTLTLREVPTGWKVGDTIVVAATTEGPQENEVRQIAAISGSLVILNQPLTYNHVPARADFEIHVANVTRNAVIESESSDVERRGHVMFMHNRNVHIAYGGFYQLGRTNKLTPIVDAVVGSDWSLQAGTGTNTRGRYAVHFHRNGLRNDGNPSTISGSAVVDSAGWGFVNHSSYVDMTDNVAFDVHGAAFSTEVGDEIGSFDGNMAIGSTGSGETVNSRIDIQDFGHQGDGFWFHGGGISVTNNIAAGNEGNGFAFYSRGLIENGETKTFLAANLDDPSIANGAATIDVRHVPMKQFENNVGYSSLIGLMLRYHMQEATHGQQSIFESSTFWNNARGVDVFYTWNTVLRDLTVVASSEMTPDLGIGLNSETRSILYDNLTVSGYRRGIDVARRGQSEVRGGTFNNFEDIYIFSGASANRSVLLTGFIGAPRIVLANNFNPVNGGLGHLFTSDIVTLNFGPFANKRVYYTSQAANAVPFPTLISGLPAQYVGLTNQQMWNQYGVALGGAVAPAGTYAAPQIIGLIAL